MPLPTRAAAPLCPPPCASPPPRPNHRHEGTLPSPPSPPPQVQGGVRCVLDAYGDVLFRAWMDTVGPCAAALERQLSDMAEVGWG